MLVVCSGAMLMLYSGLDGRNRELLETGAPLFVPTSWLDERIGLYPAFVWPYYAYFPLLFFFSVLTIRDRCVMYEGVIGYLASAGIAFLSFYFVPSRMLQPDLAGCSGVACGMLATMYGVDRGFNIIPSMHVAYSTLVWLFFRRYMPEIARPMGVLVFLIALSTLFCKRHYFVDVPAGIALAVIVFHVAMRLGPRLAKATTPIGPRPRKAR